MGASHLRNYTIYAAVVKIFSFFVEKRYEYALLLNWADENDDVGALTARNKWQKYVNMVPELNSYFGITSVAAVLAFPAGKRAFAPCLSCATLASAFPSPGNGSRNFYLGRGSNNDRKFAGTHYKMFVLHFR